MQSLTHKTCAATAPLHGLRPATITSPHVRPVSASRSPCSRLLQRLVPRSRREQDRLIARVAEAQSPPEAADVSVSINNKEDADYSVLYLSGANRPGLLTALSAALRDLSLEVSKAVVETDAQNNKVADKFYVTKRGGGKVTTDEEVANIKRVLEVLLKGRAGPATPRPKFTTQSIQQDENKRELLYTLMDTYRKNDVLSVQESIVNHVEYTLARTRHQFDDFECYQAAAYSLRDRLIEMWNDTQTYYKEQDPKRVYYLSMEFLMGRSLLNTLYNLGIKDQYQEALTELGYELETIADQERDAALGNGGLGRLAACFLDSMATLNLPAWGYGIRYSYGMFRQSIVNGFQHEQPDYWLTFGNPWEIERLIVSYPIKFYGHVSVHQEEGRQVFRWNAGEQVTAVAYDNPIPGFKTRNCINLRLWAAKPSREFDLEAFNTGDYVQAILGKQRAETLSSVLYPDDRTYEGKELRLKQQHFFVSATLQDVIRRYKDSHPNNWDLLPERVAFQLNDTHPTIAVPELMRILMDENKLGWTASWNICTKVFAFTNHTVLPEALEKWPISLMEKLLPRHMQIVYDINWRFLQQVRAKYGDDWERISRMSIIEDGPQGEKCVRMAYLAVVASHTVNGVAAIHSDIIKNSVFKDFAGLFPEKFQNKTNGVTQRRWLAFCNPPLRRLITETLGSDEWITDLDRLTGLRPHADDPQLQAKWRAVKQQAKQRAAVKIQQLTGVKVNPNALFDIQGTGDALAQGRSSPQPFGQPEAFMKHQVPRAASPLAPKQEYTGNPGGYHPNLEPVSGNFVKAAPHNMQAIDNHTSQAPRSWTPTKVSKANSPARMTANQALEQEMNELAAIEAASTATITTNRGSPQLDKPAVAAAGRSDSPSWFKKGNYNSAFEEPAADGQNSRAGSPAQPFIAQHNNLMPGDGVSAHGSTPGSSGSSTGGIGKLKDRLGVGGGSDDHSGNRVHAFREPVDSGIIATASSGGSGSLQGSAAGRSPVRGARFSNGHVTSSCRTPTDWQSQVSSQLAAGNRLAALELPGPSSGIIQCYIKRTAGLLGMAPSFELRVEATDELLAVARKRKKSARSSYLISMEGNAAFIKRADDQLVGKLKANVMGTEYTLRGKGGDVSVHKGFNAQLLAVNYKGSIGQLKDSGPRTISATVPLPESQAWSGNASTGSQYDDLGVCLEAARHRELPMNMERDLMMLHTIKPHYDSVKQAHFLDFKGRVTKPSLKNFQLVHWDHNSNQTGTDLVMMFGKKGHDEYIMDFCYPLNTLQAFGLALSSIDSKLCYAI